MKKCVIFIACICIVSCAALASTIRVPGNYNYLQEAIDAAQPGDEILLGALRITSGMRWNALRRLSWTDRPGLDTLLINKSLTIRGSGISQTYLEGHPDSSIIISERAQVIIKDLTINTPVWRRPKIVITGGANVTFENVVFQDTDYSLSEGVTVHFKNCVLRKSFLQGNKFRYGTLFAGDNSKLYMDDSECELDVGSSRGGQAELTDSILTRVAIGDGRTVIKNCSLVSIDVGDGEVEVTDTSIRGRLQVASSGVATVLDCTFSGSTSGLEVASSGVATVLGCTFSGSSIGVHSSGSATLRDSAFSGNAIGLKGSENGQIIVESCTISDNEEYGILLDEAHAQITNCSLNRNGKDNTGAGISLNGGATAFIIGCVINNNKGWGIRAVDGSVAIGWGNSVSGNPRDLYGVSQLLTATKPLGNRASVAVPRDAPTLQEAIYMIDDGGTVDIAPGVYTAQETLGIYKSVTLQGVGSRQVTLNQSISVFPDVEQVTLCNFTVSVKDEQMRYVGLIIDGPAQVDIKGCVFSSLYSGISARGSAQVTMRESTVSNNEDGIQVYEDASLEINDSIISNNAMNGIYFSGDSLVIDHCYITGNGTPARIRTYDEWAAICIAGGSQVRISYSEISQNKCSGIGICPWPPSSTPTQINISDNKIFANGEDGISCMCGNMHLNHNKIFANELCGILLYRESGSDTTECEVYGSENEVHDNGTDLRPSLAEFPWPAGFETAFVEDTTPPACVMRLHQQGLTSQVERIDVGESFDISVGDSTDNTSIEEVRFSSDEAQNSTPAGDWTDWFGWDTSSEDWNAETKTMSWTFTTSGEKELWVEIKDQADQTSQCHVNIHANPGKEASTKFEASEYVRASQAISMQKEPSTSSEALHVFQSRTRGKILQDERNGVFSGGHYWWYLELRDGVFFSYTGWCREEDLEKNTLPTASFAYSPATFRCGQDVTLDGHESKDPDGKIVTYRWDLDGDGEFEGWTTSSQIVYYWDKPGNYSVTLEVKDDTRGTCKTTKSVTVKKNSLWEKLKELFASSARFDSEWLKEIKRELRIDNWSQQIPVYEPDPFNPLYEYSDGDLATVLIQEMDQQNNPGITYGTYILDSIREKKLIEMAASPAWQNEEVIDAYFNDLGKINIWAEEAQLVSEEAFVGLIEAAGGSGIGISTLLGIPKLCEVGIALKALDNTLYRKALWNYFTLRMADYDSSDAFTYANVPSKHRKNETKEYFESLWDTYQEFGGDSNFITPWRADLQDFLLAALEKYKFYTQIVMIKSAGELRIHDSRDRVTGLVDGTVKEEIPGSIYDKESKIAVISPATDTYRYVIMGEERGNYGLEVIFIDSGEATSFSAVDMPTSGETVHQYTIDWDALAKGEQGAFLEVDSEGDGSFERVFSAQDKFDGNLVSPEKLANPKGGSLLWLWIILGGVAVAAATVVLVRYRGVFLNH